MCWCCWCLHILMLSVQRPSGISGTEGGWSGARGKGGEGSWENFSSVFLASLLLVFAPEKKFEKMWHWQLCKRTGLGNIASPWVEAKHKGRTREEPKVSSKGENYKMMMMDNIFSCANHDLYPEIIKQTHIAENCGAESNIFFCRITSKRPPAIIRGGRSGSSVLSW